MKRALAAWAALSLVGALAGACSAPLGGKGDKKSNGVDKPSAAEDLLSSCEADACPGGTREGVRTTCGSSLVGPRLLRRLTRDELHNTIEDVFPEVMGDFDGVQLSQDPTSSLGFQTDAKTLVVNGPTFKDMLDTAEDLAGLVSAPATLQQLLPCSADAQDRACAEQFFSKYGLRLFRRPITDDELARYADYQQSVAGRSDFATGIKWALSVMMQSPHAFYRSEIGAPGEQGMMLTQYELATNLAYTYTGSTPSEELLTKAANGELDGPEALEQVARDMVAQPENWETVREFFRRWLKYQTVRSQSREKDPTFADEISPLLIEETRLFLDQIMFANGTAQALMTANFTALNERLTQFYGFGDVTGDAFSAVERPAGQGIGVLAQGSLLASTAHQTETSPTLRGLRFTESFLCVTRPKPPDIVPPLAEADGVAEAHTTREKYEIHHAVGGCANCHAKFDPYGFTFEQFDEMGRYRADENGYPIDTTATVPMPDGTTMDMVDLESVANLVTATDDMENCLSGMMAAYFLSGGGGSNCLAEDARRKVASGEMTLLDYYVSLASTPHFYQRGL